MAVDRKRPYRLKERARKQEDTRRRITEATVELHGTVGAARTTIKAIAEKAGVERLTVYRHFPDEAALLQACSAHWIARHPPPDASAWAAIGDPERRLRTALSELYAWYDANERMMANNLRDAAQVPALDEQMASFRAFADYAKDVLAGGRRSARRVAAVGHALDFETWRSLVRRQGRSNREAVELMALLVEAATGTRRPAGRSGGSATGSVAG
jgi:AcrR family transcriptional regulator